MIQYHSTSVIDSTTGLAEQNVKHDIEITSTSP